MSTTYPGGTSDASNRDRLTQALVELADVQLELEVERNRRIETEAVFDRILAAMSDAVVLVDQRGRITRANAAASRLTGRVEQELVGSTVSEVFGGSLPATTWELFERSASGRLTGFEALVRAGGRTIPVSASCSVVEDADGKVIGAIYAARDLTETHRLLHELEEAEARWRVLTQIGDVLRQELDPAAALPEVCRLLGAATGSEVAIVLTQGPLVEATFAVEGSQLDLRGQIDRNTALWTALSDRRTVHAPVLAEGFPLIQVETSAPVRSAAVVPLVAREAALGAVVVHAADPRAVGDREVALAEQAARRIALGLANARLREALAHLEAEREGARFRDEIVASVSHDMQTPLATLQGAIQALQDANLDQVEQERLRAGMERHLTHLRRLVRQFLDFTLLESGRPLAVRLRPTDVTGAVRAAAESSLRYQIEVAVAHDLPLALADRDRLDQVLANLVSNALKFSPPGGRIVIEATADDTHVEIAVTDEGPGMQPGELAHLFQKFYRGRETAGTPGTGLGLYMSRALVEAQGGTIRAVSRPGEGSRFVVRLPRAEDGADGGDASDRGRRAGRR